MMSGDVPLSKVFLVAKSPRTLAEFQRRCNSDQPCRDYLIRVLWPDGFVCPNCAGRKAWAVGLRRLRCGRCRTTIWVTMGTVMEKSHLPWRIWFWAAYLLATLTPGVSALQLQRQLGLGSYRTALRICRRLQKAMVNPEREPLRGVVELDDVYVGGKEPGTIGRRTRTKSVVVIAVENHGGHLGRCRMRALPELSWRVIRPFVAANIASGSTVRTDGLSVYQSADWEALGCRHRPRVQKTPAEAGRHLPWVHQITGNLKTWLRGTHHGRVEARHLQEYLDEFTFRFNRRHYRLHGFLTLLLLATKARRADQVR